MSEDNGLDNVFRNGLSEPGSHAEYREADWDALEQMLDERSKKRVIVLWLPILGGAAAALLLVFFGWMFLKPIIGDKTKPVIAQHKSPATHAAPQNAVSSQQAPVIASIHSNQQQATSSGAQEGVNSPERQAANHQQPAISSAAGQNILASNRHRRYNNTTGNNQPVEQNTNPVLSVQNNTAARETEILYAYNNVAIEKPTLDEGGRQLPQYADDSHLTRIVDKAGPVTVVRKTSDIHLALTFLAASNVNGVGSFQQSDVGADVGALFSVGIHKFTISTGAIYAKTPYTTDYSNYHHTNYQFTTNPEYVNADCRILDIPLNLDYQLYSKHRNTFSVGAGLSSYLMLKENYTYNYAIAGTAGPDGFSISNRNQYYFGVFNLDAMYQRWINPKFSLALQPYLKLPLTDIGYGQVKLQSAGLAVGISYHIK